ncbi:ABC transporter permease [Gloeobacter violaceus]|uniref:Gll1303 protein n=1 Tax=Gloeobacter violaceus (strain ATCC 29082 / PCC 7421) TaxID=251221 RepID=Q7NL23_GLOVI|nr:DUF3526 domain-containing protein [Gloeobacter violaceus]BAC89244.1 gll1303 [Gloeobacter violaceus PCC 7421]
MIIRIARKETTEIVRDGRFRLAALIVGCLLLASLAAGWKHYSDSATERAAAERVTRAQWLAQGRKNPHSAAHYGVYAFRPQLPLASVDVGVEKYVGVAVWLEAHKQNDFRYRPAQDATAVQRFSELTAATVLQQLLPLLIVLLTFGAFADERERGTLRQVLSLGVPRRDLALGKALGISFALSLLLVPATILGVIALALSAGPDAMITSAARMLLMGASYLVYFGIFVGLSLAVSAAVRSSQLALVVLLAFWIGNGLVAPRAVADLARRVYPGPSALAFGQAVKQDIDNGVNGHNAADARLAVLKAQTLKQYGVKRVEDLPINFDAIALQEGENYGNKVFDKHYGSLWQTFERQNNVYQWGALFAPLLAVRTLSMGLSGTDFAQHRDFASAAEGYRRGLIKTMNEEMLHTEAGNWEDTVGAETWAKVPAFTYRMPSVGWVLANYSWSIVFALGWLVVGVIAAFQATIRLRVD